MDQWKKIGLPKQQEQHATGAATAITAEKKMPEFCQGNNLLRFQIKVHKSFFLGLLIPLKETENCKIYLFWIT